MRWYRRPILEADIVADEEEGDWLVFEVGLVGGYHCA